ncbi:hypothetical protein RhiirA5_433923 [Rhizophagus irregularis]|uniref:Uncharacterized protein n=1 Tax=Rhizophagus irregularis TaxID=588596 RepID=A0A2N0NQX8_9GLOM|nr:hypothetical protein RhiirA5_433923 [Rhizophagus irregularis]
MIFIVVQVNEGVKILTGPLAKEVDENDLFSTLFNSLTSEKYSHYNIQVEVKTSTGPWVLVDEKLEGKILLMKMLNFTQLKYVLIQNDIDASFSPPRNFPNAFTRLMNSRLQLLFVDWHNGDHTTYGRRFIERLTKAIWYIDPHLEKLRSRGCHLSLLFSSLPVYQQNGVYNEYYQRMKKKKTQLTRLEIFQLVNSIELSLTEPWASKGYWQEVVSNVFDFTSMMKKYSNHLEYTNTNMRILHDSENPAREPSTNCNIILIPKCDENIDSLYFQLNFELLNRELFDFVNLNQYVPNDPTNKHQFICNLQLSVPAGLYRYPHGNYLGTLNFIWRAPDTEETNECYETLKAQMITRINDAIPIYCTRQMRKNVVEKASLLRMLYHDLTGDASLANDPIKDPSITVDLRTNNGFRGSRFDIFWNELDGYFNEHNNTVVNERRIDTVLYIPYAISIRELRDRIITRLNTKYQGPPLPDDIAIHQKNG